MVQHKVDQVFKLPPDVRARFIAYLVGEYAWLFGGGPNSGVRSGMCI